MLAGLPFLMVIAVLSLGGNAWARQTATPVEDEASHVRNFDEAIDRAINNEHLLAKRLYDKEPVIETYVQELKVEGDLGFVPKNDFYFFSRHGKIDDYLE